MFDHFIVSVIVVPPLIVVATWLIADRLAPGRAAVTLAWSAVGAAAASSINLALFALKAAAEVPLIASAFGWSHRTVADDTADVPWVSWTSLALLACATFAVIRRWRRHRRVLDISSMLDGLPPAQQVVIVPDTTADAYSVPGSPGRIVVTTGMRDLLNERQYAALLAHEWAHLSERHHRLVLLAELAGSAHPALGWVARQVDYLVERAADEHAATDVGCRRTVAKAIGLAALFPRGPRSATGSLHITARAGAVPRRVGRLLHPRTATYPWLLRLLPVALAIGSIVWTAEATYDLIELLAASSRNREPNNGDL